MRSFSKYHGTGNDFIFVQGPVENPLELARKLCDRHFGIGADGLMYASPSDCADIRMHYFNSDGSEARMCGNGLRCFVRYLLDEGIIEKESFIVETAAGLIPVEAHGDHIVLDLPVNRLKLDESELTRTLDASGSVNVDGVSVYPLFMGTQHAVVFADPEMDIKVLGPQLTKHEIFPQDINVNFVEVLDQNSLKVITHERGAGWTLSCGTGVCASAWIAHHTQQTDSTMQVFVPGGALSVKIFEDFVRLSGPAVLIAKGEFKED